MSIQTLQHDMMARLRRGSRRARAGQSSGAWLPRVVELAIVLVMAWLAVRLVYAFLAPSAPAIEDSVAARSAAPLTADLSVFSRFDPFAASPVTASAEPVMEARATSLDITLNGIWAEADGGGIAILKTGNSEQRMVEVGEEIMNGVTLDRLYPDRAIIMRGGVRESVFLQNRLTTGPFRTDSMGASDRGASDRGVSDRGVGTPATVPASGQLPQERRNYPDRAAASTQGATGVSARDLTNVLAVRPVRQGSQVVGYELFPRGDGALFSRFGFVEGDRILSINGQPAPTDSERLLELIASPRTAQQVSLVIDRGGQQLNITINASEF